MIKQTGNNKAKALFFYLTEDKKIQNFLSLHIKFKN